MECPGELAQVDYILWLNPRQTVAAFLPLSSGSTPVYLLLVRETCWEQFATTSWGERRMAKLEEGKEGEEMLFWKPEAEPHQDGQKSSHNVQGGGEHNVQGGNGPPWGPWADFQDRTKDCACASAPLLVMGGTPLPTLLAMRKLCELILLASASSLMAPHGHLFACKV